MVQRAAEARIGRMVGYDNLKCLMIFGVVVAYILERSENFPYGWAFYLIIESFNIPVFIFLMGLFANNSKHVLKYIGMYLCFQTIYLVAQQLPEFLKESTPIVLQYSTPFWILWYLVAMIAYLCLTPAISELSTEAKAMVLLVSIILALLLGYDKTIGYYLSASRIVVFLPFYMLGQIINPNKKTIQAYLIRHKRNVFLTCMAMAITLCVISFAIAKSGKIAAAMFYGSRSYEELSYGPVIRGIQYAVATLWIVFFVLLQSLGDREIPLVSTIGRNTLPIFMLHGFFVRIFASYAWFDQSGLTVIGIVLITAVGLMVLLGNNLVGDLFSKAFFLKAKK